MRPAAALIWCLILAGGPLAPAGAADSSFAFELPSVRSAAIGGSHAALADDLDTLFANPAGFRSAEPRLSFFELTLGLAGPVFDIAGIILESAGGGSATDILARPDVQDLMRSLYTGLQVLGPVSLGYVGNGLGFGFFNRSGASFETRGTVPKVTTRLEEEFRFAGGYAVRIPLPEGWDATLDAGILLKAFVRGRSWSYKDTLDLFNSFADPLSLIVDEPFDLLLGVGMDVGLLYTHRERLAVGLVGRDLPAPVLVSEYPTLQSFLDNEAPTRTSAFLPTDLTLGFMARPALGRLGRYFQDLVLALDYHDLLDFWTHPESASNPVLHVGLGMELTMLEILSVRLGFYQGLLNAGLGLDFGGFDLGVAVFGRELSGEPGLRPVYNLLLGMEFRR